MAVEHVLNTRTNLSNQILTDIGNSAQMTIRDSGNITLATLTLPTTSGTIVGAVLEFGNFTDETNAASGAADHCRLETSGGVEVFRFNASGDGVVLSSLSIGAGDTVQCSDLDYTPPT